jgi:hypothetical protein
MGAEGCAIVLRAVAGSRREGLQAKASQVQTDTTGPAMNLRVGFAILVFLLGVVTLTVLWVALRSRDRARRLEEVARQERRWKEQMYLLQRTQSPGAQPPPSFGETSPRQSPI